MSGIDISKSTRVTPATDSEIRRMKRAELNEYAETVTAQLNAIAQMARHWRDSNQRLVAESYIAPFRYTLPELAVTVQQTIFWADWPNTEHRDIFTEDSGAVSGG